MPPQSRFNRDFELLVNGVIVVPPMRISFGASKAASGGLNKMTVQIYNLKESNRLSMVKDAEDGTKRLPVALRVGYEGALQLLFKGTVHRGENFREGPDLITELECLDGGFDYLNSFTSRTVRDKTKAIEAVLSDMPNTAKGKLTAQKALLRPRVLVGSPGRLFDQLVDPGETWFIDDEKLYIVKDGEVLSNYIPVVNAETGLLDTPTREQSRVTFSTLLNPALRIARLCKLESQSAPHLNGVYKVDSIGYDGDNYGANWSQTVVGLPAIGYEVLP